MSLSRLLILRNITAHSLRSALTALAVALGVAMLLAASIIGLAAGEQAAQVGQSAQADLEVFAGDELPFDFEAVAAVEDSVDVASVSASLRLDVGGDLQTLLGVDPEAYAGFHPPDLAEGVFLSGEGEVVLPWAVAESQGLKLGDQIVVTGEKQEASLTVVGILAEEEASGAFFAATPALVTLSTTQALAGRRGQIDRLEVALRPEANLDQVKADLSQILGDDYVVARAELEGSLAFNVLLIQGGLAMVGLVILFAAGFVVLNAFAMSITARVRELGALRALGMTRRQARRMVLSEAVLLGMIGVAAGLVAGLGLARLVMSATGALEGADLIVPWWGWVFSPLFGLGVMLVGAALPARRAGAVSPMAALRPTASSEDSRYLRLGGRVGGILLAVMLPALALYGQLARPGLWMALAATGVGILGLLAAMVFLLPALIAPLGGLVRPLLVRGLGTAGRLAADNLNRDRLRAALTVGALTTGLTMIMATSGLLTMLFKASIGNIGAVTQEDAFVMSNFLDRIGSGEVSVANVYQEMKALPPFDPALVAELETLSDQGLFEIERLGLGPVAPELVMIPTGGVSMTFYIEIEVFLEAGNFDFYEGDVESAGAYFQSGPAMLLQPGTAEKLGLQVGDVYPVETPHGAVPFTVAGIGGSWTYSPVFSFADGVKYFDVSGPFQLGIIIPEEQDQDQVLAQIEEILTRYPDNRLLSGLEGNVDSIDVMMNSFLAFINALLMMAVVVASLGVVNTMMLNVTERQREIGLLRAVGATRRQVQRAVVAEAVTLGIVAALAAIAVSLLMLLVYVLVVTPNGWRDMGMRADWAATWETIRSALKALGLSAALGLVASPLIAGLAAYFPARRAAGLDIIEATRTERVGL